MLVCPSSTSKSKNPIKTIVDGMAKVVYTLPWQMEHFKVPGANRIIGEFYHKSRTAVKQSLSGKTQTFQQSVNKRMGEWQTEFVKIFEDAGNDREIAGLEQSALDELASGDLVSDEAKQMRKLFNRMANHVSAEQAKMGMRHEDRLQKRANYVPHLWDDVALSGKKEVFFTLLDRYVPGLTDTTKADLFNQLTKRGGDALFDSQGEFASLPIAIKRDLKRTLDIPTAELLKHGLIHNRLDYIFNEYNHGVMKGLEWNERFGGYHKGTWRSSLRLYNQMEAMRNRGANEEQIDRFNKALMSIEGRLGLNMNNHWYKSQGWVLTVVNWIVLPLALTAQLPDLAGPLVRGDATMKEAWGGMKGAFKSMRKDRTALEDTAEWWGIVTEHNVKHAIQEQYEHGFMFPKAQRWNDRLFRYNGMQSFTRFSRLMALSMGEQVLTRWAKDGDTVNLESLGVTKVEVDKWIADGKPQSRPSEASEGETKVMEALSRFVDESILRPDATQRPVWASDPRFALIWHLNQFMYSFQQVILTQVAREVKRHKKDGNYAQMMRPLVAVGTTIPLAMVGLLIRDGLRYAGSDDEPPERDYQDYIERSGLLGLIDVFLRVKQQDDWGNSPLLGVTGPTMSVVADIVTSEKWSTKIGKATPVLNTSRAYREQLNSAMD
jgi:hypothetical protein